MHSHDNKMCYSPNRQQVLVTGMQMGQGCNSKNNSISNSDNSNHNNAHEFAHAHEYAPPPLSPQFVDVDQLI
jgi:hypothetical protein